MRNGSQKAQVTKKLPFGLKAGFSMKVTHRHTWMDRRTDRTGYCFLVVGLYIIVFSCFYKFEGPNTNTNIFGFAKMAEYEYKYIWFTKLAKYK